MSKPSKRAVGSLHAKAQTRLAREIATLRLSAFQAIPGAKAFRPGRRDMEARFIALIQKSASQGSPIAQFRAGGKLKASLFLTAQDQPVPSTTEIQADYALQSDSALQWLKKRLRIEARRLPANSSMILPTAYEPLLPTLEKQGFFVHSIILIGIPRRALRSLIRKHDPPRDLKHLGLRIAPIEMRHIPAVIGIHRREFRKNPQYGWFCTTSSFLKSIEAELKDTARVPKAKRHDFVILKGSQVVGFFGMMVSGGSSTSKSAGMCLIFGSSIQRKGISKTAYRILLEKMVEFDVKSFRGGTSQIPVMKLGKEFGRIRTAFILWKRPAHFPRSHFDY